MLGTLADTKGFKKPIFVAFIAVGVVGCIGMGFTSSWLVFLIIFILAKVGYSGSLIFYDSMLPRYHDGENGWTMCPPRDMPGDT